MISRASLAYAGIAFACGALLIQTWVLPDRLRSSLWILVPALLILFWSLWQIRERPDPNAKAFDFSPKRGLAYFLTGLVIFPVVALINAAFGAELTLESMLVMTGFGSVFAGVVGTFTEHSGL